MPDVDSGMKSVSGFVFKKIIEEKLFISISLGFIITCLRLKRFPLFTYDDFKVLYGLFIFMVIIKGLEHSNFFSCVSQMLQNGSRWLGIKLLCSTAILAMFVTNDVALIVIIPLTLAVGMENKGILVILEAITANIASSLAPFGNPQNMFIFFHYKVPAWAFIKTISPLVFILFGVVLIVGFMRIGNIKSLRALEKEKLRLGKKSFIYTGLFLLFICSILRLVPLEWGLLAILYAVFFDRESLRIDYFLLATFLVFFGFTDNLRTVINISFHNPLSLFFNSIILSQVISNVPAALLLADFTNDWRTLLWGVSVGGFGGLFGSMSTYIAYRLYTKKVRSRSFLFRLTFLNVLFLFIGVLVYLMLRVI